MTRPAHLFVEHLLFPLVLMLPIAAGAQALPADCPAPTRDSSGAGPFDYRHDRRMLHVVERRHFTTKVELLVSGESTSKPGPDLDYTLGKFPNHHRALVSLTRLGQKLKTTQVPDMRYSIECYFQRALSLWPNDTMTRLLFAQYLMAQQRSADVGSQLDLTARYAGDDPIVHYNIGVVALEVKDYARALRHAHIAYRNGWTRPELRDRLKQQGHWVEPQEAAASAPTAAASAPLAAPPASAPASAPQ